MAVNGLVTMTPTSIVSTGTGNSSSINTNGSVTFSSCATLSLNGVFTSGYDNYMVTMRSSTSSTNPIIHMQFRASGANNSTTSSYVTEILIAGGTGLTALRATSSEAWLSYAANAQRSGVTAYVFGPNLAQTTAWRATTISGLNNATLYDTAGTHNQTTSYDGFTIYPSGGDVSGLITVYGFNQ